MHGLSHPEIAASAREPKADATPLIPAPLEAPMEVAKRVQTKKWTIAGDAVARGTEQLSDYERDQLRWFGRYGASRNLSLDEAGGLLEKPDGGTYSGDSIYQALTGRRSTQGASVLPMAKAIAELRKRLGETEAAMGTGFVETPLTRRIFKACRQAFLKRRVVFIFGDSQIGKTSAISEYGRRNNHGETIVVRMPTRGALTHLLWELAIRLNITPKLRENELRKRIFDCFDPSTLLIVDEAHQCMMGRNVGETAHGALEFIRELHDRRKCGVVIVGTDVLKEGILQSKVLGQLWRRRSPGSVIQLPAMVPAADLVEFAHHFGLDPAPDRDLTVRYQSTTVSGDEQDNRITMNPAKLQDDIVRREGLGSWLRLLEDARDFAGEKKRPVSWGVVITQYCLAQAMEKGAL